MLDCYPQDVCLQSIGTPLRYGDYTMERRRATAESVRQELSGEIIPAFLIPQSRVMPPPAIISARYRQLGVVDVLKVSNVPKQKATLLLAERCPPFEPVTTSPTQALIISSR